MIIHNYNSINDKNLLTNLNLKIMNKILDVYASYTDCYLDYWNNYLSDINFCDDNDLDYNEFLTLSEVKKKMPDDKPICCLDFYYNRFINQDKYKED